MSIVYIKNVTLKCCNFVKKKSLFFLIEGEISNLTPLQMAHSFIKKILQSLCILSNFAIFNMTNTSSYFENNSGKDASNLKS